MNSLVRSWQSVRPAVVHYLRRTVQPEDAEDFAQETFMVLWARWVEPETLYAQLSVSELTAVAIGIARNKARDENRKRETRARHELRSALRDPHAYVVWDSDDRLGQEDIEWMKTLTPRQRQVLQATAELGLRRHEVAELLGLSPSTVKTYVARARQSVIEHGAA